MPGSTSSKRDRYLGMYGGKVSSPTGRSIMGASHVPNIQKGAYQVGGTKTGRLDYNKGPSAWNHSHTVVHPNGPPQQIPVFPFVGEFDFAEAELRMAAAMFGDEMCGDCIRVHLRKEHDPMTADRRVCPLCETVWPGAEPGNRRREAVEATHAARAETHRVGLS